MGKLTSHRDRCIPDVRNCDITRGLGEKRKEDIRGNNEAEYENKDKTFCMVKKKKSETAGGSSVIKVSLGAYCGFSE